MKIKIIFFSALLICIFNSKNLEKNPVKFHLSKNFSFKERETLIEKNQKKQQIENLSMILYSISRKFPKPILTIISEYAQSCDYYLQISHSRLYHLPVKLEWTNDLIESESYDSEQEG